MDKDLEKILDSYGKKRTKFSKKMVPLMIFLNTGFTAVMVYVYLQKGDIPEILVDRWFQFVGIELVSMTGIKVVDTIVEGWANR